MNNDDLDRLMSTKEEKIALLDSPTYEQENLSKSTTTDTGDGYTENNGNKLWDISTNWSRGQNSFARDYLIETRSLPNSSNQDKRFYEYDAKDAASAVDPNSDYKVADYAPVKIGLASGAFDTADRRYTPSDDGYGWDSGKFGVDLNKKRRDVNLDYVAATAYEALMHSNKIALDNRILRKRTDGNYDYLAPEGYKVITKKEKNSMFGSGSTEYYKSHNSIFNDNYDLTDAQKQEVISGIENAIKITSDKTNVLSADQRNALNNAIDTSFMYNPNSSLGNAASGLASSFVNELLVKPLDFIGDSSGLYDLNTNGDTEKSVERFFGYNSDVAAQSMDKVGKYWDTAFDSNASTADKVKAVGNGILEVFTTPETLGTSLGTLLAWIAPGGLLKLLGKGKALNKTYSAIDELVKAKAITPMAGRLKKASEFMSVDGAKSFLTKQSGMASAALGNINSQYEQFVQNNNGKELEGSDKASWYAGRFMAQMLNQNLDKLVDFKAIEGFGAVKAIVPALKAMTKKEFGNFLGTVSKGIAYSTIKGGSEAAQEYTQTMMELANAKYGSEKFKNLDTFKKFVSDNSNVREAGVSAIAGAGGSGQFEFAGGVASIGSLALGKSFKKLANSNPEIVNDGESATSFTPKVEDIVITPEEENKANASASNKAADTISKYVSMLDETEIENLISSDNADEVSTPKSKIKLKENVKDYAKALDEIDEATVVIQQLHNSDKNDFNGEQQLIVLNRTKREILSNYMSSEEPIELGSGYNPEDVVEEFLSTVDVKDGEIATTKEEDNLLAKYAKDNDIPKNRFDQIKGRVTNYDDAGIVHEDAVGDSDRSVTTYKRELHNLVNTPNASKKAVANVIGKLDYFLNTQQTRYEAYNNVLKAVNASIAAYNKQIKEGVPLTLAQKANKRKIVTLGNNIEGYNDGYINVVENKKTGKLSVNKASIALVQSPLDTIKYIKRVKSRYAEKVNNILGDKYVSDNLNVLVVRPNDKYKAVRDIDSATFKKHKINKAIVDTKNASTQWKASGDYSKDNAGRINTGKYTSSDVVLLDTEAKSFKDGTALTKEISAVYNAGATIILNGKAKNNKKLKHFLSKYHMVSVTDLDGVEKVFPKDKAAEIAKINKENKKQKDKKLRIKNRGLRAIGILNSLKDSNLTDKEIEALKKDIDKLLPEFAGDIDKLQRHYATTVEKQTKEIYEALISIKKKYGENSAEFSDELLKILEGIKKYTILKEAYAKADGLLQLHEKEVKETSDKLSTWRDTYELSLKGLANLSEWIKDNVLNPRKIMKDIIEFSTGKSKGVVFTYYKNNDFTPVTKNIDRIPNDTPYVVIDLDVDNYITVDRTTPLNSLHVDALQTTGEEYKGLNELINDSAELLANAIRNPVLDWRGDGDSILDISSSPASTILFDKNGEVNPNIAVALHIALNNFIRNSGYLLQKGKKSKEDIAQITGKNVSQVTNEMVQLLNDKGLMYKTIANSIGKDVANLLGISRKAESDSDGQSYDFLLADLGQTAIIMGVEKGIVKIDNTMQSSEYAKVVLNKSKNKLSNDKESKVLFVEAIEGSEELFAEVSELSKDTDKLIPNTNAGRKPPSRKPYSKEEKEKSKSKIRNDLLNLDIADESKEAMDILTDTEYTVDLEVVTYILDNEEAIKEKLGYIKIPDLDDDEDTSEYDKLDYESKSIQPAINRRLDAAFEELKNLVDNNNEEDIKLWFSYFFTKNGRMSMDVNTVNPMAEKHINRFAIHPKAHLLTYTHKGKADKREFYVDGENITANVHYALAQAFGFSVDKKDTAKIKEYGEMILGKLKTTKSIKEASDILIGKSNGDIDIEMEHLGQGIQALSFLRKVVTSNGKPFKSALSAETDALTSGFGLKLLQMPILKNRDKWNTKVGFIFNDDNLLEDPDTSSMNDILDSGGVKDSYQTLAADIRKLKFDTLKDNAGEYDNIVDSGYNRELWNILSSVLPSVSNGASSEVSSELRSLFKPVFMTFNYSSSINSIRRRLVEDIITTLAKGMASADLSDESDPITILMNTIAGTKKGAKTLQNSIRNKPFNSVKVKENSRATIGKLLSTMVDLSYGKQVEDILTEEFSAFIVAQENVNNAFNAMFQVFSLDFNKKMNEARKLGAVTSKQEKEILETLKDKYPAIKGPLSKMESDIIDGGIGIYATDTVSQESNKSGRKPVKALLSGSTSNKISNNKTIQTSAMIKTLKAAISAGSVIPIHYIDGAAMAKTIIEAKNSGIDGVLNVYDAVVFPLNKLNTGTKIYSKSVIDVSSSYSYVHEVNKKMQSIVADINENGKGEFKGKTVTVDKKEVPLLDYVLGTAREFNSFSENVNDARESLFNEMNDRGVSIMHMVSTSSGTYKTSAIPYKKVDRVIKQNTKELNKLDKTVDDINDEGENLTCGI